MLYVLTSEVRQERHNALHEENRKQSKKQSNELSREKAAPAQLAIGRRPSPAACLDVSRARAICLPRTDIRCNFCDHLNIEGLRHEAQLVHEVLRGR